MRKSSFAGIAFALVAAAVALWFLLDRERAQGGPRLPAAGHEAGAEVPTEAEPPARPPAPESRSVVPIRPGSFVESNPRGTEAARDEALRVLVLDAATGIPVPGADVAWTDESRPSPPRGGFFGAPSTLVSDFDRAPQRTIADARGVAVVRVSRKFAVAARSGDRFGLRRFREDPPPQGEIRLPIVAGPFVAARVVDDAGAGVPGIPILVTMSISGRNSNTARSFYGTSRSPDGLAIVHHPGVPLEPGDIKEITAWVEGAASAAKVKARPEDLRAGPITLVMPQTARVVVKVFDAEGRPLLSPADVWLSSERPAVPFADFARFDARTSDGSVEFARVPTGSFLTATAEAPGFELVKSEKVDGPKAAGERATIELKFQKRRGVVRGRALDETGAPLCGRGLEVEIVFGDRMLILPAALLVATDSRGGFSFEVDRQKLDDYRRDRATDGLAELDLLLQARDATGEVELGRRTSLPRLNADGETSLGDVRLTPGLGFASGIVVDDLGAAVAGALVIADNVSGSYPAGGVLAIGPRNLPSGYEVDRTRSDELGQFRIMTRGNSRIAVNQFSLRAEAPGYVCDRSWVSGATAKDVKIVLRGAGTIEGRIKLPDLAPVRKLGIHVRAAVADPDVEDVKYKFDDCVDSTGAFRLTGIRPGTALVEVRVAGAEDPIAWVSNVNVPRLGTTEDPRLREIDLRAHPALRP